MNNKIKLTSYNILANSYVKPEWFTRSQPKYLAWDFRKELLVNKLKDLQSEIICLQEVEPAAFDYLEKVLADHEYNGIYQQKKNRPDGCACFYNYKKLDFQGFETHYYNDRANGENNSGHLAMIARFKFDVGLITIVNTHLKWDINKENNQIGYLQIKELIDLYISAGKNDYGWVICGDFNSQPGSPAIKELINNNFVDVYADKKQNTSNSNFKAKRVDYIFCTKEIVGAPEDILEINDQTPLPSHEDGSDHIAITATLLF
jgi:mRNA deadenylase 3'-5' endonuclease subunit Ccr4